ncbi:MAG TPA: glycoside hydrolase [Clostridiales bacterium]|nr:glycoside hydrolase [Clostridiales bacterium]
MSGLTPYNRKRFFTGDPIKKLSWQVPQGKWHIYIISQVAVRNFKYFGKYIDPLNPKAIAYYIKTTHEKYRKHLGHEFGNSIKGIFTDEISPFPNDLPWSPLLPNIFDEYNGYSLVDNLPALFEKMEDNSDKVRYDYWNTVIDAFIRSYEIQIRDWCYDNNLLYVGEKPILRSKQLQYFHIPGIDAGHQKVGKAPDICSENYRANAKIASSAAHFYKKPGALCECFHSIGWGMTLQDMKWIMDWLVIQGVNWFVPHAFFYTTDSLKKHDAPPSSFYQMPYWPHVNTLSEYIKKITDSMRAGRRKVNILILDSNTSQWTAMGEKQHLREKLKKDFSLLQKTLMYNHLDFYIIDSDLLTGCEIIDGHIQIGNEKFEVLILPPLLNVEDSVVKKIKKYINSGGKIIATGCVPVEKIDILDNIDSLFSNWFGINAMKTYENYLKGDSLTDDINVVDGNRFYVADIKKVPRVVENLIKKDIKIEKTGKQNECILGASYENIGKRHYFLINTSGLQFKVKITLDCNGMQLPELSYFDFYLKDYRPIEINRKGDIISFFLEFYPYQSYMLMLREGKKDKAQPSNKKIKLDIGGDWKFSIDRMNSLRLGTWTLQVNEMSEGVLVQCKPIIDQIADSSISLPIKLKDHFGCPKEIEFPSLQCRYKTNFELKLNTPIYLVMEPNSIEGKWYILVNGNRIEPEDFENVAVYLPSNLVVDISSYLCRGINEIEVCVDTHYKHDGLVNPLYICGEFGVFKNSDMWSIESLNNIGQIGNLINSGLPFYAGNIQYMKTIDLYISTNDINIDIYIQEPYFQDAVELYINGHNAGVRAWTPYMWQIDKTWLKPGKNEISLNVSTTLLGLFEGQYFDVREHCYKDI